MRHRAYTFLVSIVIAFCLGAGSMYLAVNKGYISSANFLTSFRSSDMQEQGTQYQFISPLLFCADRDASTYTNKVTNDIHDAVANYINDKKSSGDLVDASVYFKDLNNGPSTAVNASLASVPASLLKVPTALSVYDHEENVPGFLTQKIAFGTSTNVDQSEHFQPPAQITAGNTYTVEDLVRYMLVDSDNAAYYLLATLTPKDSLFASYQDLGIQAPTTDITKYTLDVVTYASFFRVLYNASFLTREHSEHLLSLLASSAFKQGLVAGVPSGITVAHKFGEANFEDGRVQLHDCGIVYKPHEPYLLCVMTHGSDFDKLAKVISNISRIVYSTLDADSN